MNEYKFNPSQFGEKYFPHFSLDTKISMADMEKRGKLIPFLEFGADEGCYINDDNSVIHLGLGIMDMLYSDGTKRTSSENEALLWLLYLKGHEEQHARSTSNRPWYYMLGKNREMGEGCRKMIIEMSQILEKTPRRFVKDSDYDYFLKTVLPGFGYSCNEDFLQHISHSIANICEDGRIERLRCRIRPGFSNIMKYARGQIWLHSRTDVKPEELNPEKTLILILNGILSLATTGLYPRDFISMYAGSGQEKLLTSMIPEIKAAVMSGTCRQCMDHAMALCEMLVPTILDACKKQQDSSSNQKKSSDRKNGGKGSESSGTKKSGNQSSGNNPNSSQNPGNSGNPLENQKAEESEDTSKKNDDPEGKTSKTPGNYKADPDRTAGKISDFNKRNGLDGDHCYVNDKYEETGDDSNISQDNSQNSSKDKNSQNRKNPQDDKSKNGMSGNGTSEKTKNGTSGDSQNGNEEKSNGNSGNEGFNIFGNTQSSGHEMKDGQDGNSGIQNSEMHDPFAKAGEQGSLGQRIRDDAPDLSEMIEKAMEEAAKAALPMAAMAAQASEQKGQRRTEELSDESKCPDVSDICQAFNEHTRKYQVTAKLPADVKLRGDVLHNRIKRFFESKNIPALRARRSGRLDAAAIYKLTMKQADVFSRKEQKGEFDGCVEILVDRSGSMSDGMGSKMMFACQAAAIIEEGLRGLVPVKISAFSSMSRVDHEIIKNWEDRFNNNCCWNYFLKGLKGGGTPTSSTLLIAQRDIQSRPEQKKLVILLTDEKAECAGYGLNTVIKNIRKSGISLMGIYFENSITKEDQRSFDNLFDHRDNICVTPSQIDGEFIKIIEKFCRS